MSTIVKIFLTFVGLILIFAGGIDFMTTTIPGIALITFVWGVKSS